MLLGSKDQPPLHIATGACAIASATARGQGGIKVRFDYR